MYSLRLKLTKCIEHCVYVRNWDIGLHAVRWTQNQSSPRGRELSRTIDCRFANKFRIILRHHGLRRDTAIEAQFLAVFARKPRMIQHLRLYRVQRREPYLDEVG